MAPAFFLPGALYSAGACAPFPKCKSGVHILSSLFFSFEVFDVFETPRRSSSLDFCFLIFLILADTLTRMLNWEGGKHLKAHWRLCLVTQNIFLGGGRGGAADC